MFSEGNWLFMEDFDDVLGLIWLVLLVVEIVGGYVDLIGWGLYVLRVIFVNVFIVIVICF